MAVLENSLSHDKQTLERLDRELADTQQRAVISGPRLTP